MYEAQNLHMFYIKLSFPQKKKKKKIDRAEEDGELLEGLCKWAYPSKNGEETKENLKSLMQNHERA